MLIQCDHCKSRHLIADHLGWFDNKAQTIETIMREKGQEVVKKTLIGRNPVSSDVSEGEPNSDSDVSDLLTPEGELNPDLVFVEGHDGFKFKTDDRPSED